MFVVLAWGLNFSVIREAYKSFSPPSVAFMRFCGITLSMFLLCRLAGESTKAPMQFRKRAWLQGFLASGVYMVLFLDGMEHTSATKGAIALATAPIWITWLAMFRHQEPFRWSAVYGPLVAFSGVFLVLSDGGLTSGGTVGMIKVLVSAIVWAVSVILMKPLVTERKPIAVFTMSLPAAGLAVIPYGLPAMGSVAWTAVTPIGWVCLAYLILVPGSLAFVAYYKAVDEVGPAMTSMSQFLVPPTALFFESLFKGRAPDVLQVVGVGIVLLGIWLSTKSPRLKPVTSAT